MFDVAEELVFEFVGFGTSLFEFGLGLLVGSLFEFEVDVFDVVEDLVVEGLGVHGYDIFYYRRLQVKMIYRTLLFQIYYIEEY